MWLPTPESEEGEQADWVESAAKLPLAFAQVREDPEVDLQVLDRLESPKRALMIASGGETAAVLATKSLEQIHLVDVNAAQVALTFYKLFLLETHSAAERLALLGHADCDPEQRQNTLDGYLHSIELPSDFFGPAETIARFGVDYCGRYEWLFARMRQRLRPHQDALHELLCLSDPEKQSAIAAPGTTLGQAIDAAFEETMELSKLVELFGPDATANRVKPFSQHFADQTRAVLRSQSAASNPFLHDLFLGRFDSSPWDWLKLDPQEIQPAFSWSVSTMKEYLESEDDLRFDFIHLSNTLDWISPEEAKTVLKLAHQKLTSGGAVLIRQLNSQLDIRAIESELRWDVELSTQLHRRDKSFFYRELHVGWKH